MVVLVLFLTLFVERVVSSPPYVLWWRSGFATHNTQCGKKKQSCEIGSLNFTLKVMNGVVCVFHTKYSLAGVLSYTYIFIV